MSNGSKKVTKIYFSFDQNFRENKITTNDFEKSVGYLVYAGWDEPFGRPNISALTSTMARKRPYQFVEFLHST